MDAAALIAKCAKRHPGFIDSLAREVPGVSLAFLRRLQRVGEGSLDPRVALGIEHGLFIEKLNIEDQKKIIDVGVEVAVGPSGSDTMILRAEQMDRNTAARVIRNGTIAPISQQRVAIMEQEDACRRTDMERREQKEREEKAKSRLLSKLPVEFNRKKKSVTVKRDTVLTLTNLYLIVSELEG
jgi:hypothetical protein